MTIAFLFVALVSCNNGLHNLNQTQPQTIEVSLEDTINSISIKEFRKNSFKENIKTLMPVFEYISNQANVSKHIVICFWAQETGWGKSGAFLNGYNFGGIMTKNMKLVKYSSLLEGAKAYAKVLGHERYKKRMPNTIQEQENKPFKEILLAYHNGGYWGPDLKEVEIRVSIFNIIKKTNII